MVALNFLGRGLAMLAVLVVLGSWSRSAQAQPTPEDRAAAEALFEDAVRLLEAGDPQQACPKLESSQRLDPGIGTLLYLADCYQQVGRTASAWATFREAAYAAQKAGDSREHTAAVSADALKPKLHYVMLEVQGSDTQGLQIRRDGQNVGSAVWSSPVPMDPGEHQLEASAEGKIPWQGTFTVPEGPGETRVPVPELEDAPTPPPSAEPQPAGAPSAPAREQASPGSTQRLIGWVTVGAGAGSLIAGGVFSLLAVKDNKAANDQCLPSDPTLCNSRGQDLGESAVSKGNLATVFTGLGAALVVGGVVVVLTAPSEPDAAAASGSGGLALNLSAQVGSHTGVALNGAF